MFRNVHCRVGAADTEGNKDAAHQQETSGVANAPTHPEEKGTSVVNIGTECGNGGKMVGTRQNVKDAEGLYKKRPILSSEAGGMEPCYKGRHTSVLGHLQGRSKSSQGFGSSAWVSFAGSGGLYKMSEMC